MTVNHPRVLNRYKMTPDEHGVYCGRGSLWGNPFPMSKQATRTTVLAQFRDYVDTQPPALIAHAKQVLKGKNLVCFCAPLPCHADEWLTIANED